jgi:hypothetical protein
MPTTRATIKFLSDHSPALAYALVEPLARVLALGRSVFGGDLEQALVMVTITLRASVHPDFKALDPATIPGLPALPGYGINIASIAEVTGIPETTVRRKVQQLEAHGWVQREGGNLHYTPAGWMAATETRHAIIAMYAQGFSAVRQAMPP